MSHTVQDTIRAATRELTAAGIDSATIDARRLVAHALAIAPDRLSLVAGDAIMPAALGILDAAIAARVDRQPVSQIIGRRMFWGRDFKVTPAVLDPRPETEVLIGAALAQPYSRLLDLGTGSGCILLTLLAENPGASGTGTDINEDALKIAGENRAALQLEGRAELSPSDWFQNVTGRYDLIVSNPPYIALGEMATLAPEVLKWEPMAALTPGESGLEAYEIIAANVVNFLNPGGRVLLEVGPTQAPAVAALFRARGLENDVIHSDMDGRDRAVEIRLPQRVDASKPR
ncbi:MAG: peptide chain release factor N(5)-glutamine methyltransferase [Rhodobacteraceae bacterium]|nr:peptide chain release factor N(5)-glutamine methyltransferase [Paracoccaceae bacterium]